MSNTQYKHKPSMDAATVRRESAKPAERPERAKPGRPADSSAVELPASCPLREAPAMASFRAAIRSGSELSLHTQRFLSNKGPDEMGKWIRDLMRESRIVFQPWSMEILFVTGVQGEVRFSTLETMLGASSRTLTNKLRALTSAGLLERLVVEGPPTRITYRLTKHGRATAAAASALFAHLNLAALGRK